MKISVSTDSNMQNFDVNGGSEPFTMNVDGEEFSLGKVSIDGDLNRLSGSLMTGDFKMALASMDFQGAQGKGSFKDISIITGTKENGENLDSVMNLKAGEINFPNPILTAIEDVALNITANGLDTKAMIEYQEVATKMQQDIMAAANGGSAAEADPMQMAALMPVFERMLKEGLHVKTDVSAKLNGEPNVFNLDLKLLESLTFAQLPAFMTQPDEALKKVDASLDVALDKKLIDSQPMVAGMISQSPLVDGASDDYKLNLKLGKSIELNGKSMSFQELQMLVLSNLPM